MAHIDQVISIAIKTCVLALVLASLIYVIAARITFEARCGQSETGKVVLKWEQPS